MTINEFKEAMKTEEMQKEFAAFLEGKMPETEEAAIKAVTGFAAAKGVELAPTAGMGELKPEELEAVSGGSLGDLLGDVGRALVTLIKPDAKPAPRPSHDTIDTAPIWDILPFV